MKKLMIEDIKVGETEFGPMGSHIVAEARIRDLDTNEVTYHSASDFCSMPTFTLSKESTFDRQISDEIDEESFRALMEEIDNGGYESYDEFYEDLKSHELCDKDTARIWKYLVYMTQVDSAAADKLRSRSVGKCFGQFRIPVCNAEQEYRDNTEEE